MSRCIQPKRMKSSVKIACLLLSVTVLLNGTGFAVMFNCDQACCQSVAASTPVSHMGCHEDDEMAGSQSEPTVQLTALPPGPPSQNIAQCSGTAAASMLTNKQGLNRDITASETSEPTTSSTTQNRNRELISRLWPSTSSSSIVPPLRI